MERERRLRKVTIYHLALFLLPVLSLLFYGWLEATALDQRPDNPFRLSPMGLRGDIRDRHALPLAHSKGENRLYPLGAATGPLVGYHLRGRNQSGLEALLQSELSPPAPPKSLWGAMAMDRSRVDGHPPLKGPNITLTLDAEIQKAIYEVFQPRAGVVVVADRESGEILAAVSGPSFDPNEIARDWQELRADPRSPLIERVGSGLYPVLRADGQPLLREGIASHSWLAENPFPLYPGASSAVEIDSAILYSPLMLLQVAGQVPTRDGPLTPRLLVDDKTPAPQAKVPSLEGWREAGQGWEVCEMRGPKFRDSQPFQVVLGRSRGEKSDLVFATVIENADTADGHRLVQELLSCLTVWSKQG